MLEEYHYSVHSYTVKQNSWFLQKQAVPQGSCFLLAFNMFCLYGAVQICLVSLTTW